MELKKCTKCLKEYPATEEYFYKQLTHSKSKGDFYKLSSWCKTCKIESSESWALKNPEKALASKLKHNTLDHVKVKIRESSNQRRLDGKHKKWQQENPEKAKEYREKRQHKEHEVIKKEWESCKQYFNQDCAYCGLHIENHYTTYRGVTKQGDFQKEHVVHEGANDLSNCVPSCKSCNCSKHTFSLDEWYNETNPNYSKERYEKINKWLNEDWKIYYIEKKPRKPYTKKVSNS
jgi:hypothetical protein